MSLYSILFTSITILFSAQAFLNLNLRCNLLLRYATIKNAPDKSPVVSILSYFKINRWSTAIPIMKEFDLLAEKTKSLSHYGWKSKEGNITVMSVSMVPPEADHLVDFYTDSLSPLIDKLVYKAATIERIEMHGFSPEDTKSLLEHRPYAQFFDVEAGFFSKLAHDEVLPKTVLDVRPYYKILDENRAKPIMQRAIDKIKQEEGVLYFGWHRDEGNKAACHGIFQDSQAFTDHYKRVNDILSELLDGPAQLLRIEIHGHDAELRKVSETFKDMKGVFKGVIVEEFSSDRGSKNMYIREF